MAEQGRAFSTDERGGMIAADKGLSPVRYDASVVTPPMPRNDETVTFTRKEGEEIVAAWVRVTTAFASVRATRVSVQVAQSLENTFHNAVGTKALSEDAKREVLRIASDRALRVVRTKPGGREPSDEITRARITLAVAAMTLMAVEASESEEDVVTSVHLREFLRSQRPSLPRSSRHAV